MGNKFEYSYSAPTEEERREIENIRDEYAVKDKSKEKSGVARLRELDKKVKNPPLICGLSIGIAGLLVFGLGLTCVAEWGQLVLGVILGVVGLVIMGVNPYIYRVVLAKRRKKYSAQILALSEELLNGEKK